MNNGNNTLPAQGRWHEQNEADEDAEAAKNEKPGARVTRAVASIAQVVKDKTVGARNIDQPTDDEIMDRRNDPQDRRQ